MGQATVEQDGPGRVRLQGDLVLANVGRLLGECERLFQDQSALTIDLAGVEDVDSSGLALLLELLDRGQARGVQLTFDAPSDDLLNIARLSNAEALLAPAN